jgi:hypothetical protein
VPVKLFPLFHPAAALRVPRNLELLREDFANIPALLEEERQGGEQRPDEPAPEGPEGPAGEAPQLDLFG